MNEMENTVKRIIDMLRTLEPTDMTLVQAKEVARVRGWGRLAVPNPERPTPFYDGWADPLDLLAGSIMVGKPDIEGWRAFAELLEAEHWLAWECTDPEHQEVGIHWFKRMGRTLAFHRHWINKMVQEHGDISVAHNARGLPR